MSDPRLPEEDSTPEEPPAWGFRITIVLVAIYLLYRLGQLVYWGVKWLIQHL